MSRETSIEKTALEGVGIAQACVLDATSVLLTLSDGSSALVPCGELKKLVVSCGSQIMRQEDVKD